MEMNHLQIIRKRIKENLFYNTAFMLLVAVVAVFSITSPFFLTGFNLNNIIVQNAHSLAMMTGLIFVMQGGGFDLSVGYQISLVSVVIGALLSEGIPVAWAVCAGLLVGILCGAINGGIVAVFRISPVIVTLITQELFRGISYLLSRGVTYADIPLSLRQVINGTVLGLTGGQWTAVICVLVAILAFRYTVIGKVTLAMGYDERILDYNGVDTKTTKMLSYMICGFFCAVASILIVSRQGVASSAIGPGMEVEGIMAACIAGVSSNMIVKNRKRVPTINFYIGILVMAIIENGILLTGNNQYVEYCITSLVVLLSVTPGLTVLMKREK